MRAMTGGKEAGAVVIEVAAGSAAAKAGLQERDVIRQWQGRDVGGVDDLLQSLGGTAKGAKISLGVWRLQRTVSVDVTIE
jgi:serine protease Do